MTMVTKKNQMAAAEFKAKCLQVMDEVAKRRQPIIVTKRGKPVVRIVPLEQDEPSSIFGCLAGHFEILGDIEAPILPASLWKGMP
jgi:prevent-host-death family protein